MGSRFRNSPGVQKFNIMKYEIGKTVDFKLEIWDYYCNTERLTGKIESYNEEKQTYSIRVGEILYKGVKECDIVNKAAEFKHNLIDKKIEIADVALKMRDAQWGMDHPAHYNECSEEYDKCYEKLFDLMSEYDDLQDKYIMLGGEKKKHIK